MNYLQHNSAFYSQLGTHIYYVARVSVPLVTAEGVTLKLLASLRCVGGVGDGCVCSFMAMRSLPTPPRLVEPLPLPLVTAEPIPWWWWPKPAKPVVLTQHSSQQQACEIPAKRRLRSPLPPPAVQCRQRILPRVFSLFSGGLQKFARVIIAGAVCTEVSRF